MKYLLSLGIAFCLLLSLTAFQDASTDQKALQGAWKFSSFASVRGRERWNGMEVQHLYVKDANAALVCSFNEDTLVGTLQLDNSEKPGKITLAKGDKILFRGIYKVDGDMLLIMASDKDPALYRPKQFDARNSEHSSIAVFYRNKDVPSDFTFQENPKQKADVKARKERLKQLVIAAHNHHVDYFFLPPHAKVSPKDNKPLLSWRVALLPYLEAADLAKQFKMDEPWDSDHNKKLIEKMPRCYEMPGVKRNPPGTTHYQCFVGAAKPDPQFRYTPIFSMGKAKGITLGQITVMDGTSNTLLFTEAANPVVWTKPEDMLIETNEGLLPAVGLPGEESFFAAFADGSTYKFKKSINDKAKYERLMRQIIGVKDGLNEDFEEIMAEKRR